MKTHTHTAKNTMDKMSSHVNPTRQLQTKLSIYVIMARRKKNEKILSKQQDGNTD